MVNPFPIFDCPVTIASAEDMANLLRCSSPEHAATFAIAAHERACWGYDDGRVVFWERVVEALAQHGALTEVAAA